MEQLLDEYVNVVKSIESIQNKINIYVQKVEDNIEKTSSDSERHFLIQEFKESLDKIKNDKNITEKYKKLKKRQEELKIILIKPEQSEFDQSINELYLKYCNPSTYNL